MIIIPRASQSFLQKFILLFLLIILHISGGAVAELNETFAPSLAPTTAAFLEAQTWDVLRTSLIIYLPLFVLILLVFCFVRLKFPAVYNVRNTVEKIKNPLASRQHGFYRWMWNVMFITEDEFFDTCGMDALCMLRITRMGTYLSCIGVFCSIFLVPVYEYAPQAAVESPDEWVQTTSSNLSEGSSNYTATVFAAYIIFGSTIYLISKEFQWFIIAREKYLSLRVARSYSVYVSGIPKTHRSNNALAQFFRRVISDDSVYSACVAMNLPKLTIAVNRKVAIEQNLERVSLLYSLHPDKEPMHTSLHPKKKEVIERIPAIPYYNQQLCKVNEEICALRTIIENRQQLSNSGQFFYSSSQSDLQNEGMKEVNRSQSKVVVSASSIALGSLEGPREVGTMGSQSDGRLFSDPLLEAELDECTDSERKSDQFAFSLGKAAEDHGDDQNAEPDSIAESNATPSYHSLQFATAISEHLSEAGSRGITKVVSAVASAIGHVGDEGKPLNVGFVTFTKLSAVAVAVQTVHSTVPFEMEVVEAPSPEQVLWNNVGLTNRSLQVRRLLSFVVTGLLCLFWTVPVTLLVSLTEVQVLQEKFPFLEDWLEAAPWLEGLLNQISPLLLSFLNSVIAPMLLRLISTYEGVIGLSHLEASLFTKLASFSLVQTFLVASIAGSVTSALAEVNELGDVFRFLAITLPPQSIYFMQLILIQTVIGLGTELLRTTALLQAFCRSYVGPRVTEKEKSLPFIGLRPLCSPRFFLHAQLLAGTTLRFMVLFTFAVLSPFVSYILCFSFMVLEVGFRHQFVYIYPPTLDSGGRLWMMFITIITVCMVLAELILITFMGLAKARPQLYMLCPLVTVTGLFFVYLRQQHFRVARYLSSVTCDEVDTRTNLKNCDEVELDFLKDKYLQPALKTMYETVEKQTLNVETVEPSSNVETSS